MPAQLIDAPTSDSTHQITPLAYVDGYDAVNNDDYAFVAYKESEQGSSNWRVRIKGKQMPGVVFEPEAMRLQARAAGAQGKPFFTWGHSIDPSPSDQRSLQFRVHVSNGKPARVEIYMQLRNADGSPTQPISTLFDWPA